ncbi:transposase for insertion sequence element IS21 domain protein [Shigella dysenteriae 1617]|nr:transposase for insertion sequence element IS21 domain protein [Shigella dysenteriae 1617]
MLKNNNGKVVFNSGFLLLADHYNFLPRACRPRRARTKGKVEPPRVSWRVFYL